MIDQKITVREPREQVRVVETVPSTTVIHSSRRIEPTVEMLRAIQQPPVYDHTRVI